MRQTLGKIIDNNVKHMKTLEKSKAFYTMRAANSNKSLKRALSTRDNERANKKRAHLAK